MIVPVEVQKCLKEVCVEFFTRFFKSNPRDWFRNREIKNLKKYTNNVDDCERTKWNSKSKLEIEMHKIEDYSYLESIA